MKLATQFCAFAALCSASDVVYDYVIAGAGTAGLLLATILTEDPSVNVLVLEAGGDGRAERNITNPERRGTIQHTPYDWQFWSQPQPGLYDNGTAGAQYVPRGKVIGGTSAMNWMIHNDDSRVQLDIWESLLNLTGWNWDSMFTAFRQSETMYGPPQEEIGIVPYKQSYHGGEGPIQSVFQRSVSNFLQGYVSPALHAVGYGWPFDSYGGDAVGPNYFALAVNPSNYTRSYSGSVYTTVEERPNLKVITKVQVTKILWSSTAGNATASGVQYLNLNNTFQLPQNISAKEVIISGGIVGSPQLLELSGVGDPAILKAAGVEPLVNLTTVGTGLRDPPMMNYWPIQLVLDPSFEYTGTEYNQNLIHLASADQILPASDYTAASAFLNSTTHIDGVDDTQLMVFKHLWFAKQPLIEMAWQYKIANVTPYNLLPLSQGTAHINSSNALAPPAIDPKYNTVRVNITGVGEVDWDMWILAKASQYYATQLATTPPLTQIVKGTVPAYNSSFSDFYDAVFKQTGSSQHLTGGCPMLPRDKGGVVDSNLKVYGTSNVRVVDGSVFPYQPSAHPMGVTYAIAMRAAGILQKEKSGNVTKSLLPASNSSATAQAVFGDPSSYSTMKRIRGTTMLFGR